MSTVLSKKQFFKNLENIFFVKKHATNFHRLKLKAQRPKKEYLNVNGIKARGSFSKRCI